MGQYEGKLWRVAAAYVTARTSTPDGPRILGFYQDAVLPPDVPDATITHLLSCNPPMIEEVRAAAPPPGAGAAAGAAGGAGRAAGARQARQAGKEG